MSGEKLKGAAGWQAPTTIWNPMFFSVFFASMAMNLSQQMSNSQLSLYANSLGAPAEKIGTLMSMFAVTALIFRFVSGPAINSFERKKLLAMGMGFMMIAYFGFGFAPMIAGVLGVETITVLYVFRLIQGVGNAFGNSCCMTMVADVLPKEKLTTGMGYFACAQVISQSIGPTVGVYLTKLFGFTGTYSVIGCVIFAGILFTLCVVKLAPREPKPFSLKFNNMVCKEAAVPAIATFFVAMGFTSINAFLLVYAMKQGVPEEQASLFFTVYALSMLATRPMVGKLTDRFGFAKVGPIAVAATAVSLLLIGISNNIVMLLAAALVNACGYGAAQPALQSLCMKSVPPERRGSASGTFYIGMDSATIIGPTVCGYVASTVGYSFWMWAVMAIPCVISAAFILLCKKNIDKIESDFLARNAAK